MSDCGNLRKKLFQKPTVPSRPVRTFSITESRSTSAYSWKIMPMRRRARRSSPLPSFTMSTPLSSTDPEVGSTSRLTQRITVDLPAPEGPISAITCPSGTSMSMPLSARSPVRYRLVRPFMRSIDAPGERALFTGVFHAACCVDLANDAPVFLVGDRHELVLTLEFRLQRRTFPGERQEGFLDLRLQCWIKIVRDAIASGRESLRFVDRTDLRLIHDIALEHAEHHFVGDRRGI